MRKVGDAEFPDQALGDESGTLYLPWIGATMTKRDSP
jgi:hypothetical protein